MHTFGLIRGCVIGWWSAWPTSDHLLASYQTVISLLPIIHNHPLTHWPSYGICWLKGNIFQNVVLKLLDTLESEELLCGALWELIAFHQIKVTVYIICTMYIDLIRYQLNKYIIKVSIVAKSAFVVHLAKFSLNYFDFGIETAGQLGLSKLLAGPW